MGTPLSISGALLACGPLQVTSRVKLSMKKDEGMATNFHSTTLARLWGRGSRRGAPRGCRWEKYSEAQYETDEYLVLNVTELNNNSAGAVPVALAPLSAHVWPR